MSDKECPECGSKLGERSPNVAANVKRREVSSIWDRYVCRQCEQTFSLREIEEVSMDRGWFWE